MFITFNRRIGPIIKKTRLVKTTKLKVLLESDVNLSSVRWENFEDRHDARCTDSEELKQPRATAERPTRCQCSIERDVICINKPEINPKLQEKSGNVQVRRRRPDGFKTR